MESVGLYRGQRVEELDREDCEGLIVFLRDEIEGSDRATPQGYLAALVVAAERLRNLGGDPIALLPA